MNARGLLVACVLLSSGASAHAEFPVFGSWPQPGGPGTPLTLTYSYSNLLDGSLLDGASGEPLTRDTLRRITETAFGDYADVVPISFREIVDAGPLPETGEYDPTGLADIRIGQVPHIQGANAYAYFPSAADSGLAGDVVFNAQRSGQHWSAVLFYAVAQHEISHVLGLGHWTSAGTDAARQASAIDAASLQLPVIPLAPEMIGALQAVYGVGRGEVLPLPLPPALPLFALAVAGMFGRRRYGFPLFPKEQFACSCNDTRR